MRVNRFQSVFLSIEISRIRLHMNHAHKAFPLVIMSDRMNKYPRYL